MLQSPLQATKANFLSSTTSEAPSHMFFPDGVWLRWKSIFPRSLGLSRRSGNASENTRDTFGRMHDEIGRVDRAGSRCPGGESH